MSKKISLIIIILALIIGFGGGYLLGLIQQKSEEGIITFPKTNIIQSWSAVAEGVVSEILNRTLTLTSNGDTLSIPVKEGSIITRIIFNQEIKTSETQEVNFEDIKIGDEVSISVELKPDGKIESTGLIILP